MPFNSRIGSRDICVELLNHPAARLHLPQRVLDLGNRYGFLYVRMFGYPPWIPARILARRTSRYLSKREKGKLLDVGCSHGAYSFEFAGIGYEVVGIDTNQDSIDVANRIKGILGVENVSFICKDVLRINLTRNEYDVIIAFEVLEHIKDDENALAEFNELLKDNGVLMVSVPYATTIIEYSEPVGACRTSTGGCVCIGDGGSHHRNGYNLQALKILLEKCNFRLEDYYYICSPSILRSGVALFPLTYPLSLLVGRFSRNRINIVVVAAKIPKNSPSSDNSGGL